MDQPGLRITDTAPVLEEGCRVAGRYRLGVRIQNRADRRTYEAYDELSERWVQLVVQATPTVRDARLVHHGIVQLDEVGCIGSWFVSVLDAGDGEGLARLIGRLADAPLDLESLMIVGLGVCEALEHTGRWGLFHGDLGTRSVHVSPQFDPVLLEYPTVGALPLSQSAIPFGSPERQLGHEGGASSDVYALAGLLYTLRTGTPPFGWSAHAAREGHLYSTLTRHPNIPAPLMEVLQTAMEKPPRLRYPDAASFATALTEAYQVVAGSWTDEEIPGLGDSTEEVPLEEATATTERAARPKPMPPRDLGTTWESFTRSQPLELDPVEDLADRTLELGPEMLEQPTPYVRQFHPAPAVSSPPMRGMAQRAPAPGFHRSSPSQPSGVRTAYSPPAYSQPAPLALSNNRPISLEMEASGPDDFELTGTYQMPGEPDPYDYVEPYEAEYAPEYAPEYAREPARALPRHREADSIPPPSAFRPARVYDADGEVPWVDTLVPARPRETAEEESLPLMVLAAVCALAIGMAGASSVVAIIVAGLTL